MDKFADCRLDDEMADGNAGGFPSKEISLARHFAPFLTRRKLFPLKVSMKDGNSWVVSIIELLDALMSEQNDGGSDLG